MHSSSVGGGVDRGGTGGRSEADRSAIPQPGAAPKPTQNTILGPLSALPQSEPHPSEKRHDESDFRRSNRQHRNNRPDPSINIPFVVNHETRTISKFGRACLVPRKDTFRPLVRKEFEAAALLIEHMGEYVSKETLCSRLECEPAYLIRIMVCVRQALGLGSQQKHRDAALLLMSDGNPVRGYGIFVAPRYADGLALTGSPRGTADALLSDLGDEANAISLPEDDRPLVVAFGDETVRLHIGEIVGSTKPYIKLAYKPSESEPPGDMLDVVIGWEPKRAVYGIRRLRPSTYMSNAMLDEARAAGIAYVLDSWSDAAKDIFAVDSMFAAKPRSVAEALKQWINHQRSQIEAIPSNITLDREAQALIVQHLGITRHGLLGLNPLPLYDLPAPLPPDALLYVDRTIVHEPSGQWRIRPVLAGKKQGRLTGVYQREGTATLILGIAEYEGATIVVAWDAASHSVRKETVFSVEEATLQRAKQNDDVVGQPRHGLSTAVTEEVLAAPLSRLNELIEARLRVAPKRRVIDALGGEPAIRAHLNRHTWTTVINERRIQIQWCGPLLRGGDSPHIRPFQIAARFVAPDDDVVALYAGYDAQRDVVVLWRHADGQYMHADMIFRVLDSVLDEALDTGMATHVMGTGQRRIAFRASAAARCETEPLTAAIIELSREEDHREIWRSRSADIHDALFEHLQPGESSDWKRTKIRPWSATVELPTLGAQPLDIFAYRARASELRTAYVSLSIQPHIPSDRARTSFFATGREPILLGEWEDIYIVFDARAHPLIEDSRVIQVVLSTDRLEKVRTQGLASVTVRRRYGEFEETVIFATGARLREALDLRLKIPPTVHWARIRERLDMNSQQELADMAIRLQRALRLPDREALVGTRDVPREMVVVTGAPNGIEIVTVADEIDRALRTDSAADDTQLLWLHSEDDQHDVLLHAGLRAVLRRGEAPQWPPVRQFEVLWALTQAALRNGSVSDDLIRTACRHSLQWLFVGYPAPFELGRRIERGSYPIRLRDADTASPSALAPAALDRLFNDGRLHGNRRPRPDLVSVFIRSVGAASIVPQGSADDVVFEVLGQRIAVYGLTNPLQRSEDGRTDYVTPSLSPVQLARIRANSGVHHVLAAFDPGRGSYGWVFWSVRPHLERLQDADYQLHVSADLPDDITEEWRELDGGYEERVMIYRKRHNGPRIPQLLKRLNAELPQERLALLEASASKSGASLKQAIAAMKPSHQIALAMQYGFAPYERRYSRTEIGRMLGENPFPNPTMSRRAADLARVSLEAGEPLPELDEVLRLLDDPRAEQYMGSRVLLTMLRTLYGLPPAVKPAAYAHVYGDRELSVHVWQAVYRELVMRLIRGANRHGVSTIATFGAAQTIDAVAERDAIPLQGDSAEQPPTQAIAADARALEAERSARRDALVAAIALPDNAQLEVSYASAIATLRQERGIAWPSDVALALMLSWLPPDVELVMRAHLGLWPYPRRYSEEEVTTEFSMQTQDDSRVLIRRASNELAALAELSSGVVLSETPERPTLERIAELLVRRAEVVTDDELNAVLARHGLANAAPLVTETTREGTIGEFRPSRQYRNALSKLKGEIGLTEDARQRNPYWQPEQIAEVYKRIDAGEYARLLLLLRDPATRDETFADMVLRGVAVAGRRRAHRSTAMRGRKTFAMDQRETTQDYEDVVAQRFGFDSRIETFMQRANLPETVLERALAVTDEEAQWLEHVADDGSRAFGEFLNGNLRLADYAARWAGYAESRPESHELLDDAILGLERAIRGYQPRMGFTFSSYAFPAIRSRIFMLSATRHAERCGVSQPRGQELLVTRAARAELREAATANGLHREPTLKELARAVLEPRLRRQLLMQFKAEPTATQLRAGWRKHMPAFVLRMKENLELLEMYDRVARARSLDQNLGDSNKRNLHDITASAQQLAPALPGDEADVSALADDLRAALGRAGLTEREQFVLRHHFGISGYARLSSEEIAAAQRIGEEAVDKVIAAATAKVRRSPQAQAVLLPYLRQ